MTRPLLLIAVVAFTPGLPPAAPSRPDPVGKGVAVLKKSLGVDRIIAQASTQPARPRTLRLWARVTEDMPFLNGWSIASMGVDPVIPYGMSQRYFLKRQTEPAALLVKFRDGTEGPVVFFVRDNIAVVFEGGFGSIEGLAQSLDDDIRRADKIDEDAYQVLCPPPVVSSAVLDRVTKDQRIMHFRLTLSSAPPPENCEIRGVLDTGYRGGYNAEQGVIGFKIAAESWPSEYGVVVYDRASLLSRWATGRIPAPE